MASLALSSNFKDTNSHVIYKPNIKTPPPLSSPSYPAAGQTSAMGRGDEDDGGGRKNPYDLNSRIMLPAIVSLSVVVILVLILHIYARCVLRRQARRRLANRSLDLFNNHVTIHSTELPKAGLDLTVISALPIFVFRKATDGHDDECAVCLSNLENEEMARMLPNCKHTFHAQCIDAWLGSHPTCPICRTEAEPRLQPELREGPGPASVGVAAAPTAPPLVCCFAEGTSNGNNGFEASAKVTGSSSSSRLSSFRRMLSGDRSSRRLQVQDDGIIDLERQ